MTYPKPYGECLWTEITPEMLALCSRKADERRILSKRAGLKQWARDESLDAVEREIRGMLGEYGFCWFFGLEPGRHVRLAGTRDPGYDVSVWGKKMGVECTTYKQGRMFVRNNNKCDFMCLFTWDKHKEKLWFRGYYPMAWAERDKKLGLLSQWKDQYWVEQSKLMWPEWLPLHCQYGDPWAEWWLREIDKKEGARKAALQFSLDL